MLLTSARQNGPVAQYSGAKRRKIRHAVVPFSSAPSSFASYIGIPPSVSPMRGPSRYRAETARHTMISQPSLLSPPPLDAHVSPYSTSYSYSRPLPSVADHAALPHHHHPALSDQTQHRYAALKPLTVPPPSHQPAQLRPTIPTTQTFSVPRIPLLPTSQKPTNAPHYMTNESIYIHLHR